MVWFKEKRYLIALAALMVGFLFIMLLKAHGLAGNPSAQEGTLPSLIQTEQENQQLAADNDKLRQELDKYAQGESASALAKQQLRDAEMDAGLVAVHGPGIRITLDDAKARGTQTSPENYVIHEAYIRMLVNILWNGGAEAIAVNGQRIMSTTEVFCSGAYIQIGGTRQVPPYVIEAIGDAHNLQSVLQFAYTWDRLGDFQQQYGITRKIEAVKDLHLPAGSLAKFQYAQPVKEGS
ncbi:Bacterial protein of unknown function (DUF881) [Acididesulfobacillus acetoxydans]|uniref:DUF881 domain-containing protein n=1 Tax=Acididesulfobacillus acetoxydans TaxID=1561005 RepID=A0A8S0WVW5_9FIRM|nr:DUF881 domain-containing protein [Acididesulfobacillus acetoxydans]CAA7599911.1 Bacterial protein of unknown function (DUF881) [Acididesulfobacillus acetoxydans]CEJ06875.1 Bacterial protein of unknown function (DUF881) [Acididesulfobacillus acetoxydans]